MSAASTAESPLPPDLIELPIARDVVAERTLERVQRELDEVRHELEAIRRRDDTTRFYMQRLDEELRLAARLQADFLPRKLPSIGPVKFQTLFRPAGHVSGDFYDVMRLDEHHIGFYMADAVGHGMPAALLTMFLKQALVTKEITPTGYKLLEPSSTMAKLNDALVEQNLSHATFATAIYGYINTKTLEVVFATGGHPNPLRMTQAGELETIESEGSLLGIFPAEFFGQSKVTLRPGERLFIYSDGLELAFSDPDGLNTTQWREELHKRANVCTEQLIHEFSQHIDAHSPDPARKKDDITLIVLDVAAS